ncbi:hypothetical protein [Limnoglobus roseus]|uniref:DUF2281 domain-containing protein n=1 Tax=Limnoglobus roseus TaxID=2598579 RepID=A0A5C1A4Y4_9BACT|nr:hypothetical protein [Limnoglobus roseus]QEL13457.1 hypothetical protein PX52LOC_00314 [Limnoglobus roseus]
MTAEAIFAEALALPADQRAKLAEQLRHSLPTQDAPPRAGDLPKGVPVIGRGQGMLVEYIDDDEHLEHFAEYMP